ncbi:MAG: DNA polymerase I [Chromatiales bacterium]|nr:MAG: DNA polymerase I [Chromatiales bacterium]
MSEQAPLVLVDGSSYIYRAFHALPPLTNSRGEPTGAVHGVLNMLVKLRRETGAERFAVVFDASGPTFRDKLFAEYKSNRPPMPDELRSQIEPVLEAVEAMGLPLLRVSGVEADDVIGTLAAQAAGNGIDTLISTGDKDMAQLVGPHVTLVNTMTGKMLDHDGVVEKFGVEPGQIIDYLALVGDKSDNIPGVPKVGPKTAAKWLQQYRDIDRLVESAAEIPGKVGESLRANLDQLALSRELATIRCDVELDIGADELVPGAADNERLRTLYQRLELKNLLRQLPADDDSGDSVAHETAAVAAAATPAATDYETILSEDCFVRWLEKLEQAEEFAFDTETTSLSYMDAELVGVSFAVNEHEAAYVPVAHDYPGAPDQLSRERVLEGLKPLLESAARAKIGHHIKYDAHILANYDIALAGMAYDTMLESYVLNSTATRHDMDSVAALYLGVTTTKYEEVAGKGAKQLTFNEVPLDTAAPYAAEDADITLQLHRLLAAKLHAEPALESVYTNIERPLIPVLQAMERHGVLLDTHQLDTQSRELAERMRELETAAFEEAGQSFNLGSPKQLQQILYEQQGLPVIRKTPKGQPSTAEDVLQELAEEYPLPRLILDYRSVAKLKSTYTDKLPAQVNPRTGRVHTSYHQAVAATGRLSSSDPNLQNIPIRSEEGRRIRRAFVAPDGWELLAADYSQIELRIMAHLSEDEGLLNAFAADRDVHQATAAEVFGVAPDAVTTDQRRSAKAINFGLIYGMSAFGLARQLGIARDEAQAYVNLYFERYPGVKAYMDRTREQAREQGFVETVHGRRLYLPDIRSRNAQRRQYAERSAINAPMQGTAADIIKLAMIEVAAWLDKGDVPARLIMQVHDELVLEVERDAAAPVMAELVRLMEGASSLRVALKVDAATGANWDEAH